jgi:hydroxymethylglutaryl-CoA lyase
VLAAAPRTVHIVEVGPRDGLQNETAPIPTAAKIAFIEALVRAGHRHIEVAAFVSPRRVPQMADAEAVCGGLRGESRARLTALVPNEEGLERAAGAGVTSIAVFTAASEAFSQKNAGCSIAESLDRLRRVAELALARGMQLRAYVSTAFVCPYQGPVAPAAVLPVVEALRGAGFASISVADTLGAAFPTQVDELLARLRERFGSLASFALHLHDTHRRALANAVVGLAHGIEELDSSAGGLGGCPFAPGAKGNVATEDLVEMLHGMGITTGVDAAATRAAALAVRAELEKGGGSPGPQA